MTELRPNLTELRNIANLLMANKIHTPHSLKNKALEQKLINQTPESLLSLLDYHGVTMLAEHFGNLPSGLKPIIAQRKAMMVANDELKKKELIKLFDSFHDAKLDQAILFKGSALAYSHYPKPWLRPRSDSDILINANQKNRFETVLHELGYQKQFGISGEYVSYQNTFSKALVGNSTMNIDLHWRINNRQILANSLSRDELCESGQVLSLHDKALNGEQTNSIMMPSAVHSLLIACIHRIGHHSNEERLAWLYDIHLLCESLSEAEWHTFRELAQFKKISAITVDALKLSQSLLNTRVPKAELLKLIQSSQKPEASQIFLQRHLPERSLFRHDLNSLPNIKAKLQFIKETLVPSPAYIRRRMNTKIALWGYLKRLYQGIKRTF